MQRKIILVVLVFAIMLSLVSFMGGSNPNASRNINYVGFTQKEFEELDRTTVIKSNDSPTGYFVTFRYFAPEASRVRVYGEWSFGDARTSSIYSSSNYDPEDFKEGMFPLQINNSSWPAYEMTLNEKTGVWCYTIPLYSGTWSYRFVIGGTGTGLTNYNDAVHVFDPNNPPAQYELGDQLNSQVRVPHNKSKMSAAYDFSVQLPRTDKRVGSFEIVNYVAEGVPAGSIKDHISLAVYLPYEYNSQRAQPYKVLYLSHGAGAESETSWINKGSLCNMMDNLIAEKTIEPFVVVVINNYAVNFDYPNLINNIVPFIESNYNVATDKGNKAVAGLSMGAQYTQNIMLNYPDEFQYYGLFSGGFFNDSSASAANFSKAALDDANIYLAAGAQEFGLQAIQRTQSRLAAAGIKDFTTYVINGGHTWAVWRDIYVDYVKNILWK